MFFSFDGIDGAGKSTQIITFCHWLEGQGHDVVQCRDPGSTPLGDQIRGLLLGRHSLAIGPRSELLLYMAARAQLVDEVILPAMQRGAIVVSDRFLLANVVYQACATDLDVETAWQVGRLATADTLPDCTFVLDLPVELALSRLSGERDRMEMRGAEYLGRVRQGFLNEAAKQPDRICVVDAAREPQAVQAEIRHRAAELLGG